MSVQHKLFTFTRNDDLLIGSEVVRAEQTRRIIRQLQRDKQMVENWRLDIFCRDLQIITDIIVRSVEPGTALGLAWKYSISIVKTPTSRCIGPYELTIAWFRSKEEAVGMYNTVRAYITLRYGI